MLHRCNNCGDRYPCQVKYCSKCFNSPLDPNGWRVDPHRFIADDAVNPVYYQPNVGWGAYRHIQRTLRMIEPFYGLPVREIVPATIKFCYLQGGEDYVAVKNFYHHWMREIMDGYRHCVHPDAKLTYRFEWSWTTAGQAKWDLPFRAPETADVAAMHPDQVVALFHAHTIGHFPGFEHSEAGQFFRMVFDGASQVHVSTPRPDTIMEPQTEGMSALAVHEPSQPIKKTETIYPCLPDHPCDEEIPLGMRSHDQSPRQFSASVDARLDALAQHMNETDEEWDFVLPADQKERASGLVKYAQYACKEHLPKAESRYVKNRSGQGHKNTHVSSPTASGGSSGVSNSGTHTVLTQEQMVIACHADVELKRAFHGKRLMHSFGTIKRKKTKTISAQPVPENNNNDVPGDKSHDPRPACIRRASVASFESILFPQSETAILGGAGLSPTTQRTAPRNLCFSSTFKAGSYVYYKESRLPGNKTPIFCWLLTGGADKLSMGLRVLRPP